jgi:outer membrane lipoprotein
MKKKPYMLLVCAAVLVAAAHGCAPVISKSLREQAVEDLSPQGVREDPAAYKGRIVHWAGEIIDSKNLKEGTLLEILQKPKDYEGRPKDVDRSGGRFLALYDGFLDSAVYEKGRKVTVAGEIRGLREMQIGEIQYAYPLVSVKEIHLWPKESRMYDYPPHWYDRPWWYYHPYYRYHPYWWP